MSFVAVIIDGLPLPPGYRCGVSVATKPIFSHKGQRNLAPIALLPG